MSRRAILCVDDEAILLLALKQELRARFGARFAYESALGPAEAFALIEELEAAGTELALVVSDWLMPGMRGDAFLADVRKHRPAVKLVLLTGMADAEALGRTLAAGVDAFVTKPWIASRLLSTLEALLQPDPDP